MSLSVTYVTIGLDHKGRASQNTPEVVTLSSFIHDRFPALGEVKFRAYWLSMSVSLVGTWMQNLSVPWLAYSLTGSPFLLGLVSAFQFLPMLLFSLPAGTLVDRWHKRRVVGITQVLLASMALVMALLVFTGALNYWFLLVFALGFGVVNTFDFPARQTFTSELAGPEHMSNAIALNSSVFNGARVLGPAVAGLVMAQWGVGWCFLINGLSYTPVLLVLLSQRRADRQMSGPALAATMPREGQGSILAGLLSGLRYARQEPAIGRTLLAVAVMGSLVYSFHTVIPVLVRKVWGLGETSYGLLVSALGLGSFAAALLQALRGKKRPLAFILWAAPLASALLYGLLSLLPPFPVVAFLLACLGFVVVSFFTTANTTLQLASAKEYRGRVISMYSLLFGGLTPLGALLGGSLTEYGGPALALGVMAALIAVLASGVFIFLGRTRGRHG